MTANDAVLLWLLGFASAVAVFHCVGLSMPSKPMDDRPTSLPKERW